jgi:hypothetical protein
MSDRKYSQRGYQEGDRSKGEKPRTEGPRSPQGPRDPRDAPRGRGLGAPTVSNFRCARCGELAAVASAMAFDSKCGKCGADLHSCTHCNHFDPAAPLQCRQPIRERVAKKDLANRCDSFEPRLRQEFEAERAPQGGSPSSSGSRDPRAAFDALFKF